jgi:hypothetical protein
MENRSSDEIAVNMLITRDSMERIRNFPPKSVARAHSMDEAAKLKIEGLKHKSKTYSQLEKLHTLKGGNPKAARELLSSLMKPCKSKISLGWSSGARDKPAPAFCGNCGSKLSPGAAFCPNCGSRTR